MQIKLKQIALISILLGVLILSLNVKYTQANDENTVFSLNRPKSFNPNSIISLTPSLEPTPPPLNPAVVASVKSVIYPPPPIPPPVIEVTQSPYELAEAEAAKAEVQRQAAEAKQRQLDIIKQNRVNTPQVTQTTITNDSSGNVAMNTFAWGYCTYYVAEKFPVTWHGNAGQWPTNASAQGYKVDMTPESGAILVMNYGSKGHVGLISSVESDGIHITEMNFKGFNKITPRVVPLNSNRIKAVIHRQ